MATDSQNNAATKPQFTVRFLFLLMLVVAGAVGLSLWPERWILLFALSPFLEVLLAACVLLFVAKRQPVRLNWSTLSFAFVTVLLAAITAFCIHSQFNTWLAGRSFTLGLFGHPVGAYFGHAQVCAISLIIVGSVLAFVSRRYPLPAFAASSILLLGFVTFFAVAYLFPPVSMRY